jgi:hypothetical protein
VWGEDGPWLDAEELFERIWPDVEIRPELLGISYVEELVADESDEDDE